MPCPHLLLCLNLSPSVRGFKKFMSCLQCGLVPASMGEYSGQHLLLFKHHIQVQLFSNNNNVTSEALIKFQSLPWQWLCHKAIYPKTSLIWSLHVDRKWISVPLWALTIHVLLMSYAVELGSPNWLTKSSLSLSQIKLAQAVINHQAEHPVKGGWHLINFRNYILY